MNENERKSGGKRRVLMFILLAVFLISGALTVHQYLEDKRIQEEYERLAEEKKAAVKDFALTKGLLVALLAGVMSACSF